MKIKRYIVFFLTLVVAPSLLAQELVEVRYLPHWLHQAQFAGYYMAKEKGIYEKYGLDVEILPGGPNAPPLEELKAEKTEFTSTFLSSAIKAEAAAADVVNIAQLSQRSALMFIAKKSSGINSPDDFNGKRIGIWRSGFQELPKAFLNKYNIEAEIIPLTSTVNLFMKGGIDVMCVMWYNEYHQVINFGINEDELVVFDFHKLDLDYPEDAIICHQSFYANNPALCTKFVKATIEGWIYAFSNKAETLDVVINYMESYNIPANRAHQTWMLNCMENILESDGPVIRGTLHNEDYMRVAGMLLESGAIDHIPPFRKFNKTDSQP